MTMRRNLSVYLLARPSGLFRSALLSGGGIFPHLHRKRTHGALISSLLVVVRRDDFFPPELSGYHPPVPDVLIQLDVTVRPPLTSATMNFPCSPVTILILPPFVP